MGKSTGKSTGKSMGNSWFVVNWSSIHNVEAPRRDAPGREAQIRSEIVKKFTMNKYLWIVG